MNLADEIARAFESVQKEHSPDQEGQVQIVGINAEGEHLPAGFQAMRVYYSRQVFNMIRRGFRHHAGSAMPTDADELMDLTAEVMVPLLMTLLLRTFADGVQVGHQDDQLVKMFYHFERVDDLFEHKDFIESSKRMAVDYIKDEGVRDFFGEYMTRSMDYMCHVTGFAHSETDPNKVWDLWMLVGGATTCSCYMAGHRLGVLWKERDVLEGIAAVSEDDGPE